MKKKTSKSFQSAFTLLELIVSITVILVLSSLLLTSITAARAKGLEAKCINNQKNLVHAVLMFSLDEDKFPNSLASVVPNYTVKVPAGGGSGYAYAASALDYYDGDFTILQCPLVDGTVLDDPAVYSYGIRKSLKGISLQLVQTPSETVILVDCDEHTFDTADDIAFRHGNKAIAGFADGHVEQVKWGHVLQGLAGGGSGFPGSADLSTDEDGTSSGPGKSGKGGDDDTTTSSGSGNDNKGTDGSQNDDTATSSSDPGRNNLGHGNNTDHDDEDNLGKGESGHGSLADPTDPASYDGFDDDELGGGGA